MQGLNMRRSKQHSAARMDTESGCDLERQRRFFGSVIELKNERQVRRNDTLKLEPVDAAKLRRQIETLASVANHPIQLHHARKNRPAWKMVVEIEKIAQSR